MTRCSRFHTLWWVSNPPSRVVVWTGLVSHQDALTGLAANTNAQRTDSNHSETAWGATSRS
ncbi:unnamed protein product [Protopolystoma xenopodis]|uniref:Uncharacterized protein n=1 Tax=Protopolystoma xenopodis TaxID=117903 RepID=A0A3S5CII4_9PLAT|nr:unnamed protein product [Protopolystoma xenopodis]